MRILALLVITALSVLGVTPQFEQGYVGNASGWYSQPLNPHLLPTAATVEELALQFKAKIEVEALVLTNFKAFVPIDGSAYVDSVIPFAGPTKPVVMRFLVFSKGMKLPSGYVLQGDVKIAAWFFADAFTRKSADLAEADCFQMIETHEKQTLGVQ